MKKKLLIGIIAGLIILVAAGGLIFYFYHLVPAKPTVANNTKIGSGILIGYSLGTLQEERWQRDADEFVKKATELGASVDLESSNNNKDAQISQIEGMIVKGVDVLVIAPYDASSLTDVIAQAHKAGIKVLSYDRLITNAGADLYLSFDNIKVGEYQADYVLKSLADKLGQGKKLKIAYIGGAPTDNNSVLLKQGSFSVLQPKIDDGEIEVVVDKGSTNWDPQNAYKNLNTYLNSSKGDIDGVVAANDGTAFGAIEALTEHGLAGKVPVSGQDAELSAIQRIIQGTQTMTVYKPIVQEADAAVELAISLAKGEAIDTNNQITNDGKTDIPSVLLVSTPVTKDNIDSTVIKDGFYTKMQVYNQ